MWLLAPGSFCLCLRNWFPRDHRGLWWLPFPPRRLYRDPNSNTQRKRESSVLEGTRYPFSGRERKREEGTRSVSRLACGTLARERRVAMVRSRWAMRTLGSRPAVGRRQIVADKSSKRGITSAHQRSRPSSLPLSILSPPSLLRFASPRSLLCLFLPFFAPFSPVPRFLPFPSDASSSSTGSLAARGESGTMIYGLGASFHLLSIRAARSREPGPSLRRPTWPIFRAGFA